MAFFKGLSPTHGCMNRASRFASCSSLAEVFPVLPRRNNTSAAIFLKDNEVFVARDKKVSLCRGGRTEDIMIIAVSARALWDARGIDHLAVGEEECHNVIDLASRHPELAREF